MSLPRAKRIFDLALSIPAATLLTPLMALVAVIIRVKLGKPVLFQQVRPGFQEKPFLLHKFRTMNLATNAAGNPLPDEQRITMVGRLIRKSSIDELPALFNVIKGEMSLVGPRPLLTRYLPYYTERERRRHSVLPGITGLAQISGRNDLSWTERFEKDVWYVDNWSLWLDIKILVLTVFKVITASGVAVSNSVVMPDFDVERSGAQNEREKQ